MMQPEPGKPFSPAAFVVALACATVAGLMIDFVALGLVVAGAPNMGKALKVSSFLLGGLLFIAVGIALMKRHRDLGTGFICGGVIAALVGGSCATMT
jgi:hypothetical protein